MQSRQMKEHHEALESLTLSKADTQMRSSSVPPPQVPQLSFCSRPRQLPQDLRGLLKEIIEISKEGWFAAHALAAMQKDCVVVSKRRLSDFQAARGRLSLVLKDAGGEPDDMETLFSGAEVLCNEVEDLRRRLRNEKERREEAERLLRTVKQTLTAHLHSESQKDEVDSARVRELTVQLERERELRRTAESASCHGDLVVEIDRAKQEAETERACR